jgi:hypothetical protein
MFEVIPAAEKIYNSPTLAHYSPSYNAIMSSPYDFLPPPRLKLGGKPMIKNSGSIQLKMEASISSIQS